MSRPVTVQWVDPSGAPYKITGEVELDRRDGFDTVEFVGVEDAAGNELDPVKFGDRPDFERAWQDIRSRLTDLAIAEDDEDRYQNGKADTWAEEDA